MLTDRDILSGTTGHRSGSDAGVAVRVRERPYGVIIESMRPETDRGAGGVMCDGIEAPAHRIVDGGQGVREELGVRVTSRLVAVFPGRSGIVAQMCINAGSWVRPNGLPPWLHGVNLGW
jgi:hypothetical protein